MALRRPARGEDRRASPRTPSGRPRPRCSEREKDVEADLLAEAGGFNRTLDDPAAQAAMRRFLEQGGQTRDGELRLGELAGELAREPG